MARALNSRGLATLLFDLLTAEEERQDGLAACMTPYPNLRFDMPLLSIRLGEATDWAVARDGAGGLPIGYFGASTGAAAALITAAERPVCVAAVVSRGGRPDPAWAALPDLTAPTLLIVGGKDSAVLDLNWRALQRLRCEAAWRSSGRGAPVRRARGPRAGRGARGGLAHTMARAGVGERRCRGSGLRPQSARTASMIGMRAARRAGSRPPA